ncbi:NUDIX hydrolase N-terminal domain-containing protein [Carboxylicivirga taeanensis]|uniref:NUDIX hydrolase N-terminal domain-containing protein n=1 Tax=Carboxylicivirga taeanensis TaxID=1416875 RepID=UPI003F6E3FD3
MDYINTFKKIKALAEIGLVYAQNGYEVERNQELINISKELIAAIAQQPVKVFDSFDFPPKEYPTPKVDVRALILNDKDEILMAKEKMDGRWSIPGGWADIGHSPSEVVLKEVKEETGLIASTERVLAIYDKRCHPHPPQPWYVYKIMFLCKVKGGELRGNFDIEEAGWFAVDNLPPLSEDRILASQIKELFHLAKHPELPVVCD